MGLTDEQLKKKITRIVCILSDNPEECDRCAELAGCPDTWEDVTEQVNQIYALLTAKIEQAKREMAKEIELNFSNDHGLLFMTEDCWQALRGENEPPSVS